MINTEVTAKAHYQKSIIRIDFGSIDDLYDLCELDDEGFVELRLDRSDVKKLKEQLDRLL